MPSKPKKSQDAKELFKGVVSNNIKPKKPARKRGHKEAPTDPAPVPEPMVLIQVPVQIPVEQQVPAPIQVSIPEPVQAPVPVLTPTNKPPPAWGGKNAEKVLCECGKYITRANLEVHRTKPIHLNLMANKERIINELSTKDITSASYLQKKKANIDKIKAVTDQITALHAQLAQLLQENYEL